MAKKWRELYNEISPERKSEIEANVQEIKEGTARWRPIIVQALSSHAMTADELISHLLAENHGNIDKESGLIMEAMTQLLQMGKVLANRVSFNESKRMAETYLTSDLAAFT